MCTVWAACRVEGDVEFPGILVYDALDAAVVQR